MQRPFLSTILISLSICLVVTLWVRSHSIRDPGSLFFDPENGYRPQYSTIRRQDAATFIEQQSTLDTVHDKHLTTESKQLCMGIPTVARGGARYLPATIGSLLADLSSRERASIHLVVLIAHSDPSLHPAFHEPWMTHLVDETLVYNQSQGDIDHIVDMEQDPMHREKGLYDYTYLLSACHATNTPYVAILEDDVLASEGWFRKAMDGLQQAENFVQALDHNDFLYLRLFYTEEFLGWNSEDMESHLAWSLVVVVVAVAIMYLARVYSATAKRVLTIPAALVILGTIVPCGIVLFFAAGKVTVLPLPHGINAMNQYGCCSQGLVYPHDKLQDLIEWLTERKIGFPDMLIEEYADKHDQLRLALTPSVLQHVGRKSSKPNDHDGAAKYHMSVAEKLWNFEFELNDAETLHKENVAAQKEAGDHI